MMSGMLYGMLLILSCTCIDSARQFEGTSKRMSVNSRMGTTGYLFEYPRLELRSIGGCPTWHGRWQGGMSMVKWDIIIHAAGPYIACA